MTALPGDRLTEAHRLAQVRNAQILAARLQRQFGGVFLESPESARNFLDLAVPEVVAANRFSANLAAAYLRNLRVLEGNPLATRAIDLAPPPPDEQVRTSLVVTGPVAWRRRQASIQVDPDSPVYAREARAARSKSAAGMMGAAIRHAQNGARDTTRMYVARDRGAAGWVRVTAGDDRVCAFCAMLASRANYKAESFEESNPLFEGPGTAKVHDNCRCHLRPVYSSVEIPDYTEAYAAAWKAYSGVGNAGALNNFRAGWERQQGIRRKAA